MTDFSFEIQHRLEGVLGRTGVIRTPHGDIRTPAFTPVGTKATVKAVLVVRFDDGSTQRVKVRLKR